MPHCLTAGRSYSTSGTLTCIRSRLFHIRKVVEGAHHAPSYNPGWAATFVTPKFCCAAAKPSLGGTSHPAMPRPYSTSGILFHVHLPSPHSSFVTLFLIWNTFSNLHPFPHKQCHLPLFATTSMPTHVTACRARTPCITPTPANQSSKPPRMLGIFRVIGITHPAVLG